MKSERRNDELKTNCLQFIVAAFRLHRLICSRSKFKISDGPSKIWRGRRFIASRKSRFVFKRGRAASGISVAFSALNAPTPSTQNMRPAFVGVPRRESNRLRFYGCRPDESLRPALAEATKKIS